MLKASAIREYSAWLILVAVTLAHNVALANAPAQSEVDPYEGFNRSMYEFNEFADRYFLKPVAEVYHFAVPNFLDVGMTNFFNNIDDVETLANSILQAKFHNAVVSLNRVIWNTTVGLGGFIDVATYFGLRNNEEDFGQTLAVWGYENSDYLVLPLVGPSTFRDAFGRAVDRFADPLDSIEQLNKDERYLLLAYKIVDLRADLLGAENLITGGDRYVFIRNAYLQNREFLIKDGDVDDPFADEDYDLDDF
jgi:phospholipid-binding lipoprotein MlaA